MPEIYVNPHFKADFLPVQDKTRLPQAFHRTLPDYAHTPLHDGVKLADALGVGRVWVKDESSRLGLPAFKMLGASWATYRALLDWLGLPSSDAVHDAVHEASHDVPSLNALKSVLHTSGRDLPTLAAATDGNHGRAVARMAKLLGLASRIYIPMGTSQARIDAIAGEGAQVIMVDDTYDEAVMLSAREADADTLVISDTSWDGYERVPRDVIDGYSTIFAEADAQLAGRGEPLPDVVLVQIGVGALAAAVLTHYLNKGIRVIGVEPTRAACVLASLRAGEIVNVPGPHDSIMAGLNCGTASMLAFPTMLHGLTGMVAVEDRYAEEAMRLFASSNIVAGETGAAGLAGLLALHEMNAYAQFGLDKSSSILAFITESATDPAAYKRIVGSGIG